MRSSIMLPSIYTTRHRRSRGALQHCSSVVYMTLIRNTYASLINHTLGTSIHTATRQPCVTFSCVYPFPRSVSKRPEVNIFGTLRACFRPALRRAAVDFTFIVVPSNCSRVNAHMQCSETALHAQRRVFFLSIITPRIMSQRASVSHLAAFLFLFDAFSRCHLPLSQGRI